MQNEKVHAFARLYSERRGEIRNLDFGNYPLTLELFVIAAIAMQSMLRFAVLASQHGRSRPIEGMRKHFVIVKECLGHTPIN